MEQPNHQPGYLPIYTTRGAPPRPAPDARMTRPSWRGPLLVVVVMLGWLVILSALARIAAPAGSQAPVTVGMGVVVTPAAGWYSASDVWNVGPNAVSLQKNGALLAFGVEAFEGDNQTFLNAYISQLRGQLSSFRLLPVASTTVDANLAALKVLFSGVSDSSRLEGELVVSVSAGAGIVVLARASPGQLAGVQRDLDQMLRSLQVPR